MTIKPPLQKILQGILHTENESKRNHERTGSTNTQKRKGKESENNINSTMHNQTLKQQKKPK
jgi:hypothetical protein